MANSKTILTGSRCDAPTLILCDDSLRPFFTKLLTLSGFNAKECEYVINRNELEIILSASEVNPTLILIDAAITWEDKLLQDFYGFDVAAELRRDFSVKIPIIIFSTLKKSYFANAVGSVKKYDLLNGSGSGFVTFPCSSTDLGNELSRVQPLDDASLAAVVIKHCGLLDEWRSIAHKIGNILPDYKTRSSEVIETTEKWARSINQFAPSQRATLHKFQTLLEQPPGSVDISDLKLALERLDAALQGAPTDATETSLSDTFYNIPRCPPLQFSTILIADDEPQPFLINSLSTQFGYHVVEQAFNLTQAKELLTKYKPDIVLSDYYFKRSSRETEIPDKAIGDRFIHYVLTNPLYAGTIPVKPIILVTSKATLRSEADIRVGAINCSGANRATNPSYIHSVIWAEARKRGILLDDESLAQESTHEYDFPHRLEQYREDLPKIIEQWKAFEGTVRDTLTLCRLLSHSPENDDPEIVRQALELLEPYESVNNFSFEAVLNLFAGIEVIHQSARTHPPSYAKKVIRNILHGKIEQFSQVTNAAKFLITTLSEVAENLMSLAQYEHLGRRLKQDLDKYAETKPLSPVLTLLNEDVLEIISDLPIPASPPATPKQSRKFSGINSVNILVVEDNDYWRDIVVSVIEKVKSRLGDGFAISCKYFDNAADALAALPSTEKSFAIAGGNTYRTKTVVIVDLCLPENRDHAERIRAVLNGKIKKLETPRSEHGLELVRTLSGYSDNIPMIVFSTVDSIEERKAIGSWGLADEDFLVKGVDDEEALIRALIRKVEKKSKYVIEKLDDTGGLNRFRINGLPIPLTRELERTFSAIYTLCQRTGSNEFTVNEIISARGDSISGISKKVVQDQIYRIRNTIHKTLIENRVYVDIRNLIRTIKSSDDEEFSYQLNAEVMSISDEGAHESDLDIYSSEICNVLVVDDDPHTSKQLTELLRRMGYKVECANNVEDAVRVANEFLPHVVSIDLQLPHKRVQGDNVNDAEKEFGGLEAWNQIRMSLNANTVGIVVSTVYTEKSDLVAKAAQMDIPLRNFVSKRDDKWHNLYLTKIANERRRVFLGEITDTREDVYEPIVKILVGSDLSRGVLKLTVDERPLKIKVSQKSQIIGLLLKKPKELLSFEFLKSRVGGEGPVTENDIKNWPKRIKDIIEEKWLMNHPVECRRQLAEYILESSSRGMQLNAHVIDLRT